MTGDTTTADLGLLLRGDRPLSGVAVLTALYSMGSILPLPPLRLMSGCGA